MSTLNKSTIGEKQTLLISDRLNTSLNSVDLNYLGYDRTDKDSEICKFRTDANVNRVLFWLSSKRDDYVRESFKGGVLYDLLGQPNNNDNIETWESIISSRFNSEFSGDLTLVTLNLNIDKKHRVLYISMIVKDSLENSVFSVATGVNL